MLRTRIVCTVLLALLAAPPPPPAAAQRRRAQRRPASVCGDPTARCRSSVEFEPHQLPFEVPRDAVIFETEKFYAVILKSGRDKTQDCTAFVAEAERLEAQALFPRNKVFSSRCYDPGELYYEGVDPDVRFMAVYAGRTRAEAADLLARVRATGRFPGAYLRRTSTGFNGT
jgi:hypothetical protein